MGLGGLRASREGCGEQEVRMGNLRSGLSREWAQDRTPRGQQASRVC